MNHHFPFLYHGDEIGVGDRGAEFSAKGGREVPYISMK